MLGRWGVGLAMMVAALGGRVLLPLQPQPGALCTCAYGCGGVGLGIMLLPLGGRVAPHSYRPPGAFACVCLGG